MTPRFFVLMLVLLGLAVSSVQAARPNDAIVLTTFNKTYLIKDEIYVFDLVPAYEVPLNLKRHVIYTGTRDAIGTQLKRALSKRQVTDVSADDFDLLKRSLPDVPSSLKINAKKRSLPPDDSGNYRIQLADKIFISYTPEEPLVLKRGNPSWLGGTFCLHVPFFTTCDNSVDVNEVKNVLEQANAALRLELDDIRTVTDARFRAFEQSLAEQSSLISAIATNSANAQKAIYQVADSLRMTNAMMAHNDNALTAQVQYLKRVTNSLLRYSNAMASTDPRALTVQPALTRLFDGYLKQLSLLTSLGKIPVTSSLKFDWTEQMMPDRAVKTIVVSPGNYVTAPSAYLGFKITTQRTCYYQCTSIPSQCCSTQPLALGWAYGPHNIKAQGIYTIALSQTKDTSQIIQAGAAGGAIWYNPTANLYCVEFMGYKMLSAFDTTPDLQNGIPASFGVNQLPLTECAPLLLRQPTPDTPVHYRLYAKRDDLIVPFLSNCRTAVLTPLLVEKQVKLSFISTHYWPGADPSPLTADDTTTYDFDAHHYVSADCYISLEPEWIGMAYWINTTNVTVKNIPFGYRMNQFTINPDGNLSSSLEFVYTDAWVPVYSIQRRSTNNVIVDEIGILEGDSVLFNINSALNTVVDESDAFFGEANNGRDCIRKSDHYDYDLLSCFYQNDQKGYTAAQYLTGLVQTSGIARFNNKFDFALQLSNVANPPSYSFTLKPKDTADFGFFVQLDGQVCPRLVSRQLFLDHCEFTFYFTGTGQATFGPDPLTFSANQAVESVPFGYYSLKVDGKECLIVQCLYTAEITTVRLETPNVQIVRSEDLALNAQITGQIQNNVAEVNADLAKLQLSIDETHANFTRLAAIFANMTWNVTDTIPFKNFTDLRLLVNALIANLTNNKQPDNSMPELCLSPFSSTNCFFGGALQTVIVVAVIIAVLVGLYFVLVKTGLLKKCCKGTGKSDASAKFPY